MKNKRLALTAFLSLSLSMPLFAQETKTINDSNATTTNSIATNTNKESLSNSENQVVNNITLLKNETELNQYLQNNPDKPTFIFVYATWCGWCKKERPILEQLAPKREDVNMVAINYETAPEMVKKYKVTGYPTFITVKNDKFTKDAGFMRKNDLNDFITENARKVNKKAKMNY